MAELLIGSLVHAPISVSGVLYFPLDPAESIILNGFRLIRQQGAGSLVIEFRNHKVTRWNVAPDLGGPKLLNEALGAVPLRD